MRVYYNDNDPYCCQWLHNLMRAGHLPEGDIDDRDIHEVPADDLRGYGQAHFFAGIGGWPLALRMAGWPADRDVWTGSCPCTPLSSAARGRNPAIDLWPEWARLIKSVRPAQIFGEQVAHKRSWFDRVCDDLESLDYEIGAAVLPATSVGQDHVRYRLFFESHTDSDGQPSMPVNGEMAWLSRSGSDTPKLVQTYGVSIGMAQVRAGFGKAIIPKVAAAFIEAVMDCA